MSKLLGLGWLVTIVALGLSKAPAAGTDVGVSQDKGDKGATAGPAKLGLILNDPKAFQGYTLFSPLDSRTTYLIDMQGRVVQSWQGAATPACSAYLLANGHLLRPCLLTEATEPTGAPVGPAGGRVQEFTWEGELVWDFKCPKDRQHHHEVLKLPSGNVLLLVWDNKSAQEAVDAGRRGVGKVQTDSVIEIRPTGKTTAEIVWEWHLWDHLVQDHDASKANHGDVAGHPELVDINFGVPLPNPKDSDKIKDKEKPAAKVKQNKLDWTHTNAVAYNAELDQIMLSVHEFSEIWIIDHGTTSAEAKGHSGGKRGKGGDILYRWGNPQAYRAGTAADQQLFAQHNAHWIPKGLPGAGHVLVFNNGNRRPGGEYSSVDEFILPVDANGQYPLMAGSAFGPPKAIWSYSAPNKKDFYSFYISGAQRFPNGNTLICSGASGIFFEVTPQNDIVWKYVNPVEGRLPGAKAPAKAGMGGGPVFRAARFVPDHPALAGKDLTPGKTVEEVLKK